ncbi:MAG TPA: glycosyltransferase family 4 protein [Candidatus Kapabacteria bacterium]|nr:glycosyltransferase family 4 protein [Candidatus Kapabacteria bacterium]
MIAQHSVTMVGGGPRVQALETAHHLGAYGVEVEFFDAWKQYRSDRFDLFHLFGANMMTHDIALRLRQFGHRFAVSSIFYTRRSPGFMRMARRVERLANRLYSGVWTDYGLTARVCSYADAVLPNTAAEGRLIAEGLEIDRSRITVVPNGVDERFAAADPEPFRKAYGLEGFILSVGHIGSQRKNLLGLVRALATIDHPAVIVGQVQDGPYARQVLEEARSAGNVTIIQGLPNDSEMLASAYAACDVFALPSFFETPGIAALEAGLAGARIVITPHGGTREYFQELADYVEPDSVRSIAAGLERALNRPKSDALRERIRAEYLWTHVARKTADAYRAVTGG